MLSAFAEEIRQAKFSKIPRDTLACSTVRTAVDDVSKTFRDFDKPDPRKDRDGLTSRLLQMQYQGYKNVDPGTKQQKAIPLSVIRKLNTQTQTNEIEKALAELNTGAIYFCMRSCEYLRVQDAKSKRTKLLCLRNIRLFKNNEELKHSSSHLKQADCIAITFEFQKNQEKNETICQDCTEDPILCPVKSWASIVTRIYNYKGTNEDTPVNIVNHHNKLYKISSKDSIDFLRKTVRSMKEDNLGFEAKEIGTHSIRSGGAMSMRLSDISEPTIRLIGRWRSDSFLKYIRTQVREFASNISRRMNENEHFTHIPNYKNSSSPNKLRMVPSTRKWSSLQRLSDNETYRYQFNNEVRMVFKALLQIWVFGEVN